MMNASHPHLIGAFGGRFSPVLAFAPSRDDGVSPATLARVLIVEDEYFVTIELERWLSAAGYEIVGTALSADEAIGLARTSVPDFVLMDIRLVGSKDGVDAALEIFAKQNIRCIFASAHVDQATRKRAQAAQPLGWLEKPYGQQDVVQAVEAAMKLLRR